MSTAPLEDDDIQSIFAGFGRTWPCGRYLYCRYESRSAGIALLGRLQPLTSCRDLKAFPDVSVNAALSYAGLTALQIHGNILDSFAPEFRQGMRRRAPMNGDDGPSDPKYWDSVWQSEVHLWVGIYGKNDKLVVSKADELSDWIDKREGVEVVATQSVNRFVSDPDRPMYIDDPESEPKKEVILEHFGFRDGLSNPTIAGWPGGRRPGGGKLTPGGAWAPIAAGEFLLGHRDENGDIPLAPEPAALARNSSYLVLRKMEQNVDVFRQYFQEMSAQIGAQDTTTLSADALAERVIGRERDGTPFSNPATENEFTYADDPRGHLCALGSHIRRTNPRDSLGYYTNLVNRHRILRRGMTYGRPVPRGESQEAVNGAEGQGLMFIALNASIQRQFEFIQQQWINFGNDFNQGNDRDPLTGSHKAGAKMVIQGAEDRPTVVCKNLQRFCRVRGGEYLFLPGLRAYHALADQDSVWGL